MIDLLGAVTAFGGMVATPLAARGGRVRRDAAAFVVGGLALTTFDRVCGRWGVRRATASAASVLVATWSAEAVGSRTGRPFGRYVYTGRLRPAVGGVPAHVPLAWYAMAVPARETVHAALGARPTRRRRIVGGAIALAAWDLFLDPQMTAEGYWRWSRAGRYRGIPRSNFAGWLVVGIAVMAILEATLPPEQDADPGLVTEYAGVGAMEALGFAAFFRDRLVAAVGGAAMLPVASLALWRLDSVRS